MRYTHALSGVLLFVVCCSNAAAAETGSRWWPFGHKDNPDDVTQSTGTLAPTLTPAPQTSPAGAIAGPQTSSTATATQQATRPEITPTTPADPNWMLETPSRKVSWPRVNMPKFSMPKPHMPSIWTQKSREDADRNAWVGKSIEPVKPSPLQSMSKKTKGAWNKTVDVLTPGDSSKVSDREPRTARRDVKPQFWKRMMGSGKSEGGGAETMPEFMAQQRVD